MFEGYRVVVVTPAGRRRYMELLVPQVLGCPLVDRYEIWLNTSNRVDRAFLVGLAKKYDRVRLVPHPVGAVPSTRTIHAFHRTTLDADTIYIRFDDDIVWLEPGFFETLLRFRIEHPEHFLVTPLVINNAICTYLLQTMGKIRPWRSVRADCYDRIGWGQPDFALALHRFLLALIEGGETARLHCGAHPIAFIHFSINCICYFGRDLAAFDGVVGVKEEEELTAVIPVRLRRTNAICADVIAAHFAFFSQRAWMDGSDILARYEAALLRAGPEIAALRAAIGEIRRAAEGNAHAGSREGGERPRSRVTWSHWLRIAQRVLTGRYRFNEERNRVWVKPGPTL